jgi:diaminopimelate epimerase
VVHRLRFSKMHGAGNDFVLVDLREAMQPDRETFRALADRHRGIGCDQVIGIVHSPREDCVAGYKVWNADGSSAQQCGNGARCVAAWLLRAGIARGSVFRIDSPTGVVDVEAHEDGTFALDLGVPEFSPARIPLRGFDQSLDYALAVNGEHVRFGAVSMGNPHALIVVDTIINAPVVRIGTALQSQHVFPDSVNVGFAQILSPSTIRLRVFERGVGETLACGSGACAAVAILVRQGRVGREVQVDLPGGMLDISWPDDLAPVRMRGPAAFVFEGEWLQ